MGYVHSILWRIFWLTNHLLKENKITGSQGRTSESLKRKKTKMRRAFCGWKPVRTGTLYTWFTMTIMLGSIKKGDLWKATTHEITLESCRKNKHVNLWHKDAQQKQLLQLLCFFSGLNVVFFHFGSGWAKPMVNHHYTNSFQFTWQKSAPLHPDILDLHPRFPRENPHRHHQDDLHFKAITMPKSFIWHWWERGTTGQLISRHFFCCQLVFMLMP